MPQKTHTNRQSPFSPPQDLLLTSAQRALASLSQRARRSHAGRELGVIVSALRECANVPAPRWLAGLQALADQLFDLEEAEGGAWDRSGSIELLSDLHDAIVVCAEGFSVSVRRRAVP
jgi:hypothetical protein